jgi:hypothetical protein
MEREKLRHPEDASLLSPKERWRIGDFFRFGAKIATVADGKCK